MRRFPACRVNDSSFICRWGLFRPDWKAVARNGEGGGMRMDRVRDGEGRISRDGNKEERKQERDGKARGGKREKAKPVHLNVPFVRTV